MACYWNGPMNGGERGCADFAREAFGPQAAMRPCMGRDGGCADSARRVRTASRSGTRDGEGWGMCGFRPRRSDRRPQWVRVRGERGCADFAKGARTAGRSGIMGMCDIKFFDHYISLYWNLQWIMCILCICFTAAPCEYIASALRTATSKRG